MFERKDLVTPVFIVLSGNLTCMQIAYNEARQASHNAKRDAKREQRNKRDNSKREHKARVQAYRVKIENNQPLF